jgi:uncharacterized circularly permuted ATP-grasp superfamily protein/uncharacterized alpha-E superfamily protein
LASYQPLPNAEDELIDRTGEMRPQWRELIRNVSSTPSDELTAIIRRAERLLDENGFPDGKETDPDPKHRPWQLDYLPLVLPEDEWTVLRSGLIQRARLLNVILADIYGPQRLLREGLLPATLIFANPHFLRPCHDTVPADGIFLHYYAADLGRGPDGQWRVLADRTQAPAGFGYALENRIVLSRCAQHLYRHQHIHRLAAFFQTMHNGLLARSKNEEPRIVVLNSGPAKRAYFDHSYVARYLGYTMAEGADLTVRNDRVYLKTVEGLKQVDLILRGIDAGACDPLELSNQSSSGIAGLLQAVRAGTVTIANSLGSGLVETKAFMAYLPRLCRDLLGEDLILPSNGTWWCGDAEAKHHVMENMNLLTIESAFERRTILMDEGGIDLGGEATTDQRAAIAERLKTNGKVYVAQENVSLSTTPTTDGENLAPRPMSVRLFLTSGENGYEAMPGGLTRAWAAEDVRTTALRPGDIVKDTWVLSPKPVSGFTLLKTRANAPVVRRRNKDIPSHSADNLFWLGRYTERAEDEMRVLRSVLRRLTEDLGDEAERLPINRALTALVDDNQNAAIPPNERRAVSAQELDAKIRSLMFEANEQRSLQETLHNLHRTATLARDWLSAEAWRALGRLQMDIARYPSAGSKLDVGDALMRVDDGLRLLSAFSGMEMENMTRDFGWRFLDMGRRLERGRHLSRLLRHVLASSDTETDGSLTLLLELADSIMTYRWRYLATPMLAPVLDLLLLDETNPRSIGFQIAALAEHVENLPQNPDPPERNAEQRIVIALQASIRLSDFKALGTIDASGTRPVLDQLLDDINAALPRLSEAITRTYFSHAEARRPADLMRS